MVALLLVNGTLARRKASLVGARQVMFGEKLRADQREVRFKAWSNVDRAGLERMVLVQGWGRVKNLRFLSATYLLHSF